MYGITDYHLNGSCENKRITQPEDAYQAMVPFLVQEEFNCDKTSFMMLVLNNKNDIIENVFFPFANEYADERLLEMVFDAARTLGANKVILGQGKSNKWIFNAAEEKAKAFQFKKYGDKVKIPVADQLLMTRSGYSAMSENGVSSVPIYTV